MRLFTRPLALGGCLLFAASVASGCADLCEEQVGDSCTSSQNGQAYCDGDQLDRVCNGTEWVSFDDWAGNTGFCDCAAINPAPADSCAPQHTAACAIPGFVGLTTAGLDRANGLRLRSV